MTHKATICDAPQEKKEASAPTQEWVAWAECQACT